MKKETKTSKWTTPDPGNALLVFYVGLVLGIIILAMAAGSHAAQEEGERAGVELSEVQQGSLLFSATGKGGELYPAPRLSQDVEIYITTMTARIMVRQRFENNTDQWQEAIYVFPLPHEAAVDQLRMKIGDRVIVGEIREKEEAKKVYAEARKAGKKASLLSQERPNIFTMAVANIAPGEEIEVEIEYQQVVTLDAGIFSLRFPMVVGPRYIPGTPLERGEDGAPIQVGGTGWSMDTDRVPDASRITPTVASGEQQAPNTVRLMVELAAGFPVAKVESLYHGVTVTDEREGVQLIRFDGRVKADRDFVLEWKARGNTQPEAALFAEKLGVDSYLLLMLSPPTETSHEETAPPRELIFVLDTSGSMAGTSIVQAREALKLAISRLRERDRFNVIEFNSTATKLFEHAQVANAQYRAEAIHFVSSLNANGGTEIAKALDLALDGRSNHERIRQVMFLTDGSVGNEQELLDLIASRLGDSRLFTVGIGSAPNSYFMSRAALMGRGSYCYIGKKSEVEQKMRRLFEKLEHPAITDIRVETVSGQPLEYYPHPVPDLYAGEPLVVSLKLPKGIQDENIQISGRLEGKVWQREVAVQNMPQRPGVATLWARKKIRSLMDSRALGTAEKDIKDTVLKVALAHHLVTKYSSLVAVAQEVSRPAQESLHQSPLANSLPAGWQAKKIFGGTAQTATPAQLQIIIGLGLLLSGLVLCIGRRRWGRV
jgi:Ca-activated chloride channel family protein